MPDIRWPEASVSGCQVRPPSTDCQTSNAFDAKADASGYAEAVKAEFRENEDLPNTTNPDDWAKIAGRRGERIVHVRPVFDREVKKLRKVENISTGHYL